MISIALTEELMKPYDMRTISEMIKILFTTFNNIIFLVERYDLQLLNHNSKTDKVQESNVSDRTFSSVSALDINRNFIRNFRKRLRIVKNKMTNDEKIIYEYSIEKKETDSVVQSIIKKYGKTYYHIKKSCYLKLYLYFNLDDENSYFVKYVRGHLYWCSFFWKEWY